jgi:hypothetical protein
LRKSANWRASSGLWRERPERGSWAAAKADIAAAP